MAELLLDHVGGDALGHQLGGVGVAEAVGVNALLDPRALCCSAERVADVGVVEAVTLEGAEHLVVTVHTELLLGDLASAR